MKKSNIFVSLGLCAALLTQSACTALLWSSGTVLKDKKTIESSLKEQIWGFAQLPDSRVLILGENYSYALSKEGSNALLGLLGKKLSKPYKMLSYDKSWGLDYLPIKQVSASNFKSSFCLRYDFSDDSNKAKQQNDQLVQKDIALLQEMGFTHNESDRVYEQCYELKGEIFKIEKDRLERLKNNNKELARIIPAVVIREKSVKRIDAEVLGSRILLTPFAVAIDTASFFVFPFALAGGTILKIKEKVK